MGNEQIYRGMSVSEGVAHVEQHFTASELKNVTSFSELHEICDANMTLPYHNDCNASEWMEFGRAVIKAFDRKYQTGADRDKLMVKKGDIVKFLPQWQDTGDEDIEYRAIDDEYDGRVEVEAQVDLPLKPTQIVPVKWLDIP